MASGLRARAHSKVLESTTEFLAERGIDATSVDTTLTQAGTAARWERHGISAKELAMHLLDTSAGVKSATGNLSDYKRRRRVNKLVPVAAQSKNSLLSAR